MIRTFKVLKNFQIYNAVLLTTVTNIVHDVPQIYIITRSLYLLTTFIQLPYPPPPSNFKIDSWNSQQRDEEFGETQRAYGVNSRFGKNAQWCKGQLPYTCLSAGLGPSQRKQVTFLCEDELSNYECSFKRQRLPIRKVISKKWIFGWVSRDKIWMSISLLKVQAPGSQSWRF